MSCVAHTLTCWIMIACLRSFVQRFSAIKKGAHTELNGIGPELVQIVILRFCKRHLRPDIPRPIQPDVVEEHLACAAGHGAASSADTESDLVDIGQIDALIGKSL